MPVPPAAAATLTPFTAPQQNTNPTGLAAQSAALSNSDGTSAGTSRTIVEKIPSSDINKALSLTPSTRGSALSPTVPSIIVAAATYFSNATSNSAATVTDLTAAALTDVSTGLSKVASTLGSVGVAQAGGAVSAAMGRATSVGALSVPQTWGTLTCRNPQRSHGITGRQRECHWGPRDYAACQSWQAGRERGRAGTGMRNTQPEGTTLPIVDAAQHASATAVHRITQSELRLFAALLTFPWVGFGSEWAHVVVA